MERRKQEELRRPYQNKTGRAIRNARPFDEGARENAPFPGTEDWRGLGRVEGIEVSNSGARRSKLGFVFFFKLVFMQAGTWSGLTLAHDVGQLGNGEET